ncbi:hypothetical protein JX265_008566 [Neoarthrinium moseri]|uniref:Uncharacterized protein n=1 Tax=Neoarthrinium moseri TaxID=1658444 RepID=A0A9Q0ANG9_9PEZI|nr:hypothetical protein JX265_008566 [Neoarthrinium moseri]
MSSQGAAPGLRDSPAKPVDARLRLREPDGQVSPQKDAHTRDASVLKRQKPTNLQLRDGSQQYASAWSPRLCGIVVGGSGLSGGVTPQLAFKKETVCKQLGAYKGTS